MTEITRFIRDLGGMSPFENGPWVRYEDVQGIMSESMEQSRIIGMSSERELSLLAKIDNMQKELEEKTKALQEIAIYKGYTSEGDVFWRGCAEEQFE